MRIIYRLLIVAIITAVLWKSFQYFLVPETTNKQNASLLKNENQGKIKVSVYYEALCSDSRFFIIKQLIPAFEAISGSISIDLVPYGKAKTIEHNGKITFECQHAALECLANKIHACGIKYVPDSNLSLKYVACMINDNMIPRSAGETCAQKLGVDYEPIRKCTDSEEASLLLKAYGERTHALDPPVRFIPTVELNNSQQEVPQSLLLKNLLKELCTLLVIKPAECL